MTRQETITKTRQTLLKIPLETIKQQLETEFFNMNEVIEALYYGITAGKNIILYGPGGFGKTQIVKRFLELVSLESQTIVGNEDTEVDALLGIPNIKKLTEESVYEIAFEKTVFRKPGVLILEEFLDVRPSTAAALKDVLSEGGMRQGDKFIESLISSIIVCTNKSPEELSIDNSSSAFYKERFPIRIEVAWNSYRTEDYTEFLKLVKKNTYKEQESHFEILAEIASRTSVTEIVSPRIVLDAADLIDLHKDIKVIRFVDGLDTLSIDEIIEYCKFTEEKISLKEISKRISDYIGQFQNTSVLKTLDFITELEYLYSELAGKQVNSPNNVHILTQTLEQCKTTINSLRASLKGNLSETKIKNLNSMLHDTDT